MKIRIGEQLLEQRMPFIGDLRKLKPEFGFGYGTCIEQVSRMDGLTAAQRMHLFDDDAFTDAFVAWLWMLKLVHGERDCTRADIEQLPLDEVEFVFEPDDQAKVAPADADPTEAPTGSDRGDEPPAAEADGPTPASTTTSKPRSGSGSSS